LTTIDYIFASLLIGSFIALIKAYIDIQILKNWKKDHTDDHHLQQSAYEKTFAKIFEKFEDISEKLNILIGKLDR
jgi:hypothetical protein